MTFGLLALVAVLLLAFARVPLGIALLAVSFLGIGSLNGFEVARTLVPMTLSEAVFSYELAVVPLFILMGNILSRTGISDDLFRAAYAEAPRGDRVPAREKWQSLSGVWPFCLLFLIVIGGLYLGVFTATEAGGIGAGMALIIASVQRRLTGKGFREIFVETASTSVMLYVVLFGAMLFAKLISYSGLADALLELVQGSGLSKMGILLAILAVFLVLGCVMDSMAIILIFVPLFTPTLVAQGFDLVWFGIIVVVLTEIGLITPPIGMNVFVLKANLPNVTVGTIFRGLVPFIACDVLRLGLLVMVPSISLVMLQWMK